MSRRERYVEKVFADRHKFELDNDGCEIPDSTPGPIPVGFKRPLTLQEQVRQMIRLSQVESEEINSIEVDDEDGFSAVENEEELAIQSPYDLIYDEDIKKELPRFEKVEVDRAKRDFDNKLNAARIEKDLSHRKRSKAAKKEQSDKPDEAPADEDSE